MFDILLKNQKKKRRAWDDRITEVEKRLSKEAKKKREDSSQGSKLKEIKGRLAELTKA